VHPNEQHVAMEGKKIRASRAAELTAPPKLHLCLQHTLPHAFIRDMVRVVGSTLLPSAQQHAMPGIQMGYTRVDRFCMPMEP
jgi:hypothetical protein